MSSLGLRWEIRTQKYSSTHSANDVLNRSRPKWNVAMWKAMLGWYIHNGQYSKVLKPFSMMRSSSLVTNNICTYALTACTSVSFFEMGKEILKDGIEMGLEMDCLYGSLTVGFFGKNG